MWCGIGVCSIGTCGVVLVCVPWAHVVWYWCVFHWHIPLAHMVQWTYIVLGAKATFITVHHASLDGDRRIA